MPNTSLSSSSSVLYDTNLTEEQLSLIDDFPVLSEQSVSQLRNQEVTPEWLNNVLKIIPRQSPVLQNGLMEYLGLEQGDPLPQVHSLVGTLPYKNQMEFIDNRCEKIQTELKNQEVPEAAINRLTDFIRAYHYKQISKYI